jgi:hypothetical protein
MVAPVADAGFRLLIRAATSVGFPIGSGAGFTMVYVASMIGVPCVSCCGKDSCRLYDDPGDVRDFPPIISVRDLPY